MPTMTPQPTPMYGPDPPEYEEGGLPFLSEAFGVDIKAVTRDLPDDSDDMVYRLHLRGALAVVIGTTFTICYQQQRVLAALVEVAMCSRLKPLDDDTWDRVVKTMFVEAIWLTELNDRYYHAV